MGSVYFAGFREAPMTANRRFYQIVNSLMVALGMFLASTSQAKDHGVHSPKGRVIYEPHETFATALDQNRRRFVAEVATGLAPEGNLALLLGGLNFLADGLDVYAGVGFDLNPSRLYSGSMRYSLRVGDVRPYVSLGYMFKNTFDIGVVSHNTFLEVGHRWVLHRTYHLILGAGVRRILKTSVTKSSPLRRDEIDPALLADSLSNINSWAPTVVLRFSRAF